MIITQPECVYVALGIQHAMRNAFPHCIINGKILGRNVTELKTRLFISVFNQHDAQNLFDNKFYIMPLHVSSTCAHHQEVRIVLHSLWYHHMYRCDDNRGCVMQF